MFSRRTTAAAAAMAAAGLAGGVLVPSSGAQDAEVPTISMNLKGKRVFFSGPETIAKGATLEIFNNTSPKQVGPHTFTLVEGDLVPKTKADKKACRKLKSDLCLALVKGHKANPETGEVKKLNVDVGKRGWDTSFGKTGDSWFSMAKNETESRKVTAPVGTTLSYFCVIHPEMSGEIEVVE
jgi:plastocyanin